MLIICPLCTSQFSYTRDKVYSENTILVEGGDDEMLISALIQNRNLPINSLTIEPKDGYSSILSRLTNMPSNSGFRNIKKLLVIADANSAGTQTRFQEIVTKLDPANFSIPTSLGQLSSHVPNQKQVGIFLFPDNQYNGIVEDLCLKALTHPDKMHCIEEHIRCIRHKGLFATNAADLPKSKFHIYMSTSTKPTGSIGGATQSGDLDLNSNKFNLIVNFLQLLT